MFKAYTFEGIDAEGKSLFGITTDIEGHGLPKDTTWNLVNPVNLDESVLIYGTSELIMSLKHKLGQSGVFWCPKFEGVTGIRYT